MIEKKFDPVEWSIPLVKALTAAAFMFWLGGKVDSMTSAVTIAAKNSWTVQDQVNWSSDLRYQNVDKKLIVPNPITIHSQD